MIKYETLILGELQTNCYLVWDGETKEGLIIDPADDGVGISEIIQNKKIIPKGILLTHGHFDHTMAALDLKLIFNIPIYMNIKDMFLLDRQKDTATHFLKKIILTPNILNVDYDLEKLTKINLGQEFFEIIQTPGHTPGSVCFLNPPQSPFGKGEGKHFLFSGDTMFAHDRGRTNLRYSSTKDIYKSLRNLIKLPDDTIVLPGHGEETTIGSEKSLYKIN